MENLEQMEGQQEKVESVEQKTAKAQDIEELKQILREEVEEVKGTTYRKERGNQIEEKSTIYTGEELAKRIEDIEEGRRHLNSITQQEGLKEITTRLLVDSSKNWNEFTYWVMEITADEQLGEDLQEVKYYSNIVEQAKDGVKTIIDEQGQPRSIEKAIPRRYGLRTKFIELMNKEGAREAA